MKFEEGKKDQYSFRILHFSLSVKSFHAKLVDSKQDDEHYNFGI